MKRLTNRMAKVRGALSLVTPASPADRDAAIIEAAVAVHRALDGAEIDAPGPIGDALMQLGRAIERSGR